MDMRSRVVCVPLLALMLSFLAAACGKSDDSQRAGSADWVPVNGTESPSAASPAGAGSRPAAGTATPPGRISRNANPTAAEPAIAEPTTVAPKAPVKRATTSPAVRKTTKPKPQLPAGDVPDFLVGSWSGGPGDQTGRYLTISSSGKYERGFSSGGVESSGTVVANETVATFYDRNGGKER